MKHFWSCTLVNSKGKKFHAGAWSSDTAIEAARACKNGSNRLDVVKIIVRGSGDNNGQTITYCAHEM